MQKFGIGTLMQVLFGTSLCLVGIAIFAEVWTVVGDRRDALRTVEVAKAGQAVFVALQNLRLERGPTRVVLVGKTPADEPFIRTIAALRDKSAPALDDLLRICSEVACAPAEQLEAMRSSYARVAEIRRDVDRDFAVPLERRSDGIGQRWDKSSTDLVDRLESLSDRLSSEVRLVDPIIGEQVMVKQASWTVRDFAGMARMFYAEAMQAGALSPGLAAKIADHEGRIDSAWKLVRGLTARPDAPANVVAAVAGAQDEYFARYQPKLVAIREALAAGRPSPVGMDELMEMSNKAFDSVAAVSDAALAAARAHAEQRYAALGRDMALKIALFVVTVMVGAGGVFAIRRRLVRPIGAIVGAMQGVAGGDLTVEVPFRDRRDEIGDLAGALAVFKDNAVEKERLAGRQQAEEEKKARQRAVVDAAIGEFEASAQRFLAEFSAAAERMTATAAGMSQTAEETRCQAAAVAAASDQTSASVQTVASSAEELTSSISEIGRQVAQSTDIAGRAVGEARRTDRTVNGLSDAAQRIGEVVQLIDSIAAQTNLLALNATIEAARAGEAGKGFAVVAGEVKELASQTAKATQEISTQIAAMQDVAKASVEAIRGIGETIGEVNTIAATIASAVEEQGAATQEISRSVQEAARGVTDVSGNIAGVSRAAEDTGSAARQVTDASADLAGQAEALGRQIASFLGKIQSAEK